MSRFAIIQGGTVANIVEAEADFAAAQGWIDAGNSGIGWTWDGEEFSPPPAPPPPSAQQVFQQRFQQRAAAKDGLLAWMAADNMTRVQAGTWTVPDLINLLDDLAPVNAMMQTLSFELAAQAITASTHPLMTQPIRAAWVAKLTEHFYNAA